MTNKEKPMEIVQKTVWKIGDEYIGIIYFTIKAQFKQHLVSFRLKPISLTFEAIRMQCFGGKVNVEFSILSFKTSVSFQV